MSLFDFAHDQATENHQVLSPLAEKMRPKEFSQFMGQGNALGSPQEFLNQFKNYLPNLIFWGPPGSGKTTFAHLIQKNMTNTPFIAVNAIDLGSKKIKELGAQAHKEKIEYQKHTILFIDEIHRLNKSQQDMLLPFTEKRDLILIGATTENPAYEINAALLSRSRVIQFSPLAKEDLNKILTDVFKFKNLLVDDYFEATTTEILCDAASGDARKLLNFLEQVFETHQPQDAPMSEEGLKELFKSSPIYYDKKSHHHHDCVSAFIKSIRGSDPNAALYYLARMIEGGEDPVFIARRLIILASEDVGNADPKALSLATAGLEAVKAIGFPEARITLSQVTTYMACAPKSNSAYMGIKNAQAFVKSTGSLPVPTKLSAGQQLLDKKTGKKKDASKKEYLYSHNYQKSYVSQSFLPENVEKHLEKEPFFEPKNIGFEKQMAQYLQWLKE
jgi:putative ATPase